MGGVLGRWGGRSGSEVTTPGPESPLLGSEQLVGTPIGDSPREMTPGLSARWEGGEGNRSSSPLWH